MVKLTHMSYAKLFSSITESSLWSEPKEVRLLFVTMLARADATGYVEASVPGLARVANLEIHEVEKALESLQSPDPHSKNPSDKGRRIIKAPRGWLVLNYEEYRNRGSDDERREYMRNYMREYRKSGKLAVNNSKQELIEDKQSSYASASASREGVQGKGGFKKPTREELELQASKIGLPQGEVDRFLNYYESNGWRVGKNPMKSWTHALSNWKLNCNNGNYNRSGPKPNPRNAGVCRAGPTGREMFDKRISQQEDMARQMAEAKKSPPQAG